MEFPVIKEMESSSNISNFESRDKGRSFVKMLKRRGPNKEPWGTQEVILIYLEFVPLIDTNW